MPLPREGGNVSSVREHPQVTSCEWAKKQPATVIGTWSNKGQLCLERICYRPKISELLPLSPCIVILCTHSSTSSPYSVPHPFTSLSLSLSLCPTNASSNGRSI